MSDVVSIKINFRGGIVSPGELYNILVATGRAGVKYVSFGLRQQLLIRVSLPLHEKLATALQELGITYEINTDQYPNIISSYPAEEVFINNTWLSEGVYKDIFDQFDYSPTLKVNISDSNQSFTPMLTGNINWVASAESAHFWHLFIRFPKTNIIYEWSELVYSNDIARLSKLIEQTVCANPEKYIGNNEASGKLLFENIDTSKLNTKTASKKASLPAFNLPYYEGLNRYNNKYWLGIYRRDELFEIGFLKTLCLLCLETKIGQICSTPWKSIILKGIEEKDRPHWNVLLERYQINMRHAANELNFQVEDTCEDGLALKNYLVKKLNDDDIRTFGICIGIKTRRKSEVFSSILIRRRPLIRFFGKEFLFVYDILCARDFNPNERTGKIFSKGNPRLLLPEQLRRAVIEFNLYRLAVQQKNDSRDEIKVDDSVNTAEQIVQQCPNCKTIYHQAAGEPENNIKPGTAFEDLPATYCCQLCETEKGMFVSVLKSALELQPI